MKTILELFKGTGSVGKIFSKSGDWKITSVDNVKKFEPTICVSVLDLDYKSLEPPDFLWASPPCNSFSNLAYPVFVRDAKTMKPLKHQAVTGDALLAKTIEIINYYLEKKPDMKWVMENPHGTMWKSPLMEKLLPYTTAQTHYILYGDKKLKKTDFFNNFNLQLKSQDDEYYVLRMRQHRKIKDYVGVCSMKLADRYSIPPKLIEHIYKQV